MFASKKPYSSVTVSIERLTSEAYEEDDFSGIPDLVEAIKLQATGPSEAARALRKKLKYGNVHRQLRALTLLDGLIQNAGSRFQRTFVDEPLLERLRVCGTSDLTDQQVRDRCKVLYAGWAREYKKTPGLEKIAGLYKELPRRKQVVTQEKSKVLKETERDPFEDDEDEEAAATSSKNKSPSPPPVESSASPKSRSHSASLSSAFFPPSSSASKKSKKDKKSGKKKHKPFNLEEEKEKMKSDIAESSLASVNLLNALQRINREQERVSENRICLTQFETCKLLRRHILRYIQHIETEQWLGALIQANDQLVLALMTFEQLDRSIDADSDSDDELAEQAHAYRMLQEKQERDKGKGVSEVAQILAGLQIGKSESPAPIPLARPTPPPVDEEDELESASEDENDPFGDSNAVDTPVTERAEPTWR